MMKKICRSPYFTYGFLSLALVLGLSACGKSCNKEESTSSTTSGSSAQFDLPAGLEMMPAGRQALVGVNKAELDASILGKKLNENLPPQFSGYLQGMTNLLIGVSKENQEDFLFIIKTDKTEDQLIPMLKVEATANQETLQESDYQGVKLYKDPSEVTFAFVKGQLLLGQDTLVKQSIDLSRGQGKSVQADEPLMTQLKSMDTSKTVWILSNTAADAQTPPISADFNPKSVDLVADLKSGAQIKAGVVFENAEKAKETQGMIQLYKGIFSAQSPEMATVFQNLQVVVQDKRVNLELKLNEADVSKLLAAADNMAAGAMAEEAPLMEENPPTKTPEPAKK